MIAIINYGMGNLRSVLRGLERVNAQATITSDPETIRNADKVVLPGVGAFGDCMKNLKKMRLIDPILEAIHSKKPFLGICLGFQVLFEESEEFGKHLGLAVFPGRVVRFRATRERKVPHMGWNRILKKRRVPILNDLPDNANFYFVHSYYIVPEEKDLIATTTDYGKEFCSSIAQGNLFACQFHPEKSQAMGQEILKKFSEGIIS